jgi:hypothetical protein
VRSGGRPSITPVLRVEAAAAFAARFTDPLYVPTGGVGRHGPSEPSVMTGLLRGMCVPSERVLLEETATDTLYSVRVVVRLVRGADRSMSRRD